MQSRFNAVAFGFQTNAMNRTGLLIALTVAGVVGLSFGLYPELDMALAALFYDLESRQFLSRVHPWLYYLRYGALWLVAIMVLPPLLALAVKAIWPRRPLLMSGRAIIVLLVTLALGPGIVVNTIFKDNWGRPRPGEVTQLGGDQTFVAWWDARGTCPNNCSFASGDASAAFWTLAPAALTPPAWRPVAYAASIAFGLGVGVLRMVFGGHFFSDVVFAGVFVFLVIWLVHGLVYRWPRTRTTDEAVDAWLERHVGGAQDRVARLFGANRRRSGA